MKQYNAARTYQFRVQLTRDDHRRLADHCRLYNGAVRERRDAWRMARRSITFPSQCRELTLVRQDDPVWAGAHRSLAVATLKRVDLALQTFFRRVKAAVNGGGKVGHVGGSIVGLRRTSTTQWYVLPPPLTVSHAQLSYLWTIAHASVNEKQHMDFLHEAGTIRTPAATF